MYKLTVMTLWCSDKHLSFALLLEKLIQLSYLSLMGFGQGTFNKVLIFLYTYSMGFFLFSIPAPSILPIALDFAFFFFA